MTPRDPLTLDAFLEALAHRGLTPPRPDAESALAAAQALKAQAARVAGAQASAGADDDA